MAGEEVIINISALNNFLGTIVQPYLLKKAREIANEASLEAPHGATGDLRNSIQIVPGRNGSVSIKVNADYAGFVETGTGPGHRPNPNPPYVPKLRRRGLILWSESKNLNAYQVRHGISQKGTPANPFLENSIAKVLARYRFRWISREIKEQ